VVERKGGGHYWHNVCDTEVTETAVADGILLCCERNITVFSIRVQYWHLLSSKIILRMYVRP